MTERVRRAGGWLIVLTGCWLAAAVLAVAAAWQWQSLRPPWYVSTYLAATVVCSAASFAAYGLDKRQAGREGRRVSERTLHLLALAGGWPGALFAQRTFRHKSQKRSFRAVYWSIVAGHWVLMAGILYGWLLW